MEPFDPGMAGSPLLAAVRWVEAVLLGPVALAVGTIAVAAFGFLMLSGRVEIRTGARVVIGCFILFGARSIAAGFQSAAATAGTGAAYYAPMPPTAPTATAAAEPASTRPPAAYDPFAGASATTDYGTCCE